MTKCTFFLALLCSVQRGSRQTTSGEFEELKSRMFALENRQKVCEKETSELKMMLQNNTVRKRDVNDVNVAFSTLLSHNTEHIGLGQTIKFDHVLLNEGSGYSTYTGTFTVPATGVYMFSYFFGHFNSGQVWLQLMHNGHKVNAGTSDGAHMYQDLQGGNIAIIRVQTGDAVWLESFVVNDATLYGSEGFTSFSGVLLY